MVRIISIKQTLLLIIAFSIISCNSQPKNIVTNENSMNWETIKIPSETGANSFDYDFNQYYILDSLTGFIIGNNSGSVIHQRAMQKIQNKPLMELHENYQTVLFKSRDGGLNFKRINVGKGSLDMIVSDNQNNLYVIKSVYNPYPEQQYSILKSEDLGETWKEISSFDGYRIKTIRFYNELVGVACIEKISQRDEDGQLFKTVDGGKSWIEVIVKTRGVSLYGGEFKNENELFTFRETTNLRQSAIINLTTGDSEIYDPSLEDGYYFSGMFHDESTGDLYSIITKFGEPHSLKLFNHNTQKVITCNFKSDIKEYIGGISISGDFIGILREDNGRTHYYYSTDFGKNWIKENLPDDFVAAHPTAVYGKGLVWVKSSLKLYDFQVRKKND